MSTSSASLNAIVPDHLGRTDVFLDGAPAIRAERYHLQGDFRPHDHPFLELALILGGSCVHHTLHGEQPLSRGSMVVVRPGAWHAYQGCDRLEVLNAYIGQEVLHHELAWVQHDPFLGQLLWTLPRSLDREGVLLGRLEGQGLDLCEARWEALEGCPSAGRSSERTERLGYLLLLLTALVQGLPLRDPVQPSLKALPAAVQRCIEAFEADPARGWTLEHLSRLGGLNASHLSRLFTRSTGLPPLAYLNRWRLERAAVHLAQTEHPVSQIGAEVGWWDANLFARRFRGHFGLTPSAFRQRYR